MIVLKNADVLSLEPGEVRSGVDIVIDGALIAAAGKGAGRGVAGSNPKKVLDCSGRIVMPGLVCSHNHFYSALSRGILARIAPADDFVSTLANLWWRLDRAIDRDALSASAAVAAVDALRAGCTAVVDHHASPSFITHSLDVLKDGFEKAGLRGVLCYEATDRNGEAGLDEGIQENRRFAARAEEERKTAGNSRLVEAMIGGHAPFTLPDRALRALGDAVRETGRGFHVHASEDSFDPSFSHRFHGADVLERLDRCGLVTDKAVIAHGVHLSTSDRGLLNERGGFLVHNCRSNMNNRVGYNTGLPGMKNVALGTDGIGSDMLEELKFAYFKHRDAGGSLSPADFIRFLHNGNAILGRAFGEKFGQIREGFMADLVVLSYDPPTPILAENAAGHAVFGMTGSSVETVIVGGRVVMENRRFPFDVSGIFADARRAASELWARMDGM
jgi:putative selenium metabolism protein SsnA